MSGETVAALRALLVSAEAARAVVATAVEARRREAETRLGLPAGCEEVLFDAQFGCWLDRYGDVVGILAAAEQALAAIPPADAAGGLR